MSRAIQLQHDCLLGLIEPSGSIYFCESASDMEIKMQQLSSSAIFYNQHPDAIQFIESHPLNDGQISIEIFQDIEGVFGLRGYQMDGKIQNPINLSFDEIPTEY
jgi:hypothetical protein